MPPKFLENQPNIFYKSLLFIARSNIFISVCAASLAAWSQQLFSAKITFANAWITLGATFIMYNTQQLYLEYVSVKNTSLFKPWIKKNTNLLRIVVLIAAAEIYPLQKSEPPLLITYALAAAISLLYFMPFSNLRSIPFLKSLIIGLVWGLVCVIAPLETSSFNKMELIFCFSQLFLITALCVLFNIRDVDDDKKTKTYTVPVLYGIKNAKIFAIVLLTGYLIANVFVAPVFYFIFISSLIFVISCAFTFKSYPKNHPLYYLFGVDGIILLQSVLGLLFLW